MRELRRSIAAENGVPPYIVFGDATLQQMAHYMPQNLNSLSHISGVGAVKLKQYGDEFLAVICEYARENNLADRTDTGSGRIRQRSSETSRKGRRTATHETTKHLLDQSKTVHEVAQERELTANTIVSHIEMLVQSGEALDLRAHLPAGERVKHIEDAFSRLGYTRIAPVRELLGHDYSYEEIRLVRAFVRQQVSETAIDE